MHIDGMTLLNIIAIHGDSRSQELKLPHGLIFKIMIFFKKRIIKLSEAN